jgi:hypothetical protein
VEIKLPMEEVKRNLVPDFSDDIIINLTFLKGVLQFLLMKISGMGKTQFARKSCANNIHMRRYRDA